MLYWMCEKTQSDPTNKQLEHAIKRNFGGHDKVDAFEIFKSNILELETERQQNDDLSEQVHVNVEYGYSPVNYIKNVFILL